ncbi:MAG: peptidylprolyl isomerase [Cyclobacteriaceae bacterium]|nr:peptidylprolyl isomerase [Cyclobacteriaceae bacterium]MCK5208498.1 peptidylprolyl isomerase [Cyclobacteriaceae bacterium]MCK5276891.1 peptidylprolyl isomerase [Cyclobacteriaceae bacterium]MCK5469875.1 peptidylprolyl isomerase [Cyclobacteriaceae bacterium]MCK5705662.1 peptidylprolyl isomerase [Cyclobacteriaceae bacterium]
MKILKYINRNNILSAFVLNMLFGGVILAQSSDLTVIDKIIAKVDNYIVLKSELERSYLQVQSSGDYNTTKCQILEGLVLNKLMVAKAEIDSVVVEEEIIDRQLDMKMQGVIAQAGGDQKKLEEAFGKSMEEIREDLRDQEKEQMVAEKMQMTITEEITVTPAEVKRFFKNIPKDSLPYFSTEVEIGQIVKKPVVSAEEKERIENFLMKIRGEALDDGIDFQVLAGRHSEGPSKLRGGNLGDVERGQMVPEFEAAALKLKNDEISLPVETEFGFHIIQMVDRRGNIYNARHILIAPKFTEKDFEIAAHFLDSIKNLFLNDTITFDRVAKKFSDDKETSSNGGFIRDRSGANRISVSELDPGLFFTMDTMQVGSITDPLKYKMADGKEALRIIYFKSKMKPHQANLDDDYQKIYMAALNAKKQKQMSDWFKDARHEVFIEIDPEYNNCNILQ